MSTEYVIYKKKDYDSMDSKLLQFKDMAISLEIKYTYINHMHSHLKDNLECDNSFIMAHISSGWKPIIYRNEYIKDSIDLLSPTDKSMYVIVDEYGKIYSYDEFLCILLKSNNENVKCVSDITPDEYGFHWSIE